MPKVDLYIKRDENSVFIPIVTEGITLESERSGAPARLTFTVIKDNVITFPEGAPVALYVDGKGVFMGYVFQKNRDKEHHIECVCYDQLRYFKNKSTYVVENKTASELVKMVAEDFQLKIGTIENTGYKIATICEQDATLFDIVLNALDETVAYTKQSFVLYDDFGKITLRNLENMQMKFLVDESTAENFNYSSSIDDDTYNQVLLLVEDDTTGGKTTLKPYLKKDESTIKTWGVLQYSETVKEGTNAALMAEQILKLKNRKTRYLEVNGIFGDISVRAGCSLPVHLNLGDIQTEDLKKLLVCDRVTHHFNEGDHVMDIVFWDANTFTG